MIQKILNSLLTLFIVIPSFAQRENNGTIQGRIYNNKNGEPVPFANVVLFQTTIGSAVNVTGLATVAMNAIINKASRRRFGSSDSFKICS